MNWIFNHLPSVCFIFFFFLASNNLSGVIPPEIGVFKNLISLQLYSNELFSALPSRIGELKQLQELMLQINSIGGTLPPSIGNLTNLKELRLYGNYLSGTIPETVGNLKSLGKFFEFCSGPAWTCTFCVRCEHLPPALLMSYCLPLVFVAKKNYLMYIQTVSLEYLRKACPKWEILKNYT